MDRIRTVTEDAIINLGPRLLKKQHIEMFLVTNFVLLKKHLVMKRFVLLKKLFSSSYLENAMKNVMG